MKAYWDASALVEMTSDPALEVRLITEGGYTRTHTIAEVFSTLTGKAHIRASANDAAKTIRAMAGRMQFVNLSEDEVLDGLDKAQSLGVRGGRVHGLLHALAAVKSGADALLTLDKNDFAGLAPGLSVEQV